MATRKQRRRRSKELRHEYVWEDAEGNEVDPREAQTGSSNGRQQKSSPSRRTPQPPSWNRTLKRGLVFAPLMLVTIMLLARSLTLTQKIIQTAIVVAIFIPFSYVLDSVFYRRLQRRNESDRRRGS